MTDAGRSRYDGYQPVSSSVEKSTDLRGCTCRPILQRPLGLVDDGTSRVIFCPTQFYCPVHGFAEINRDAV